MMPVHQRSIVGTAAILSALVGGVAQGQELPETTAAAQYSITQGFRQKSLPLLRRLSTNSPEAVNAALIGKLCAKPCPALSTDSPGNLTATTTDTWSLQILGDGSAAQFRDLEVEKRAPSLARDRARRIPTDELVRAGRAYIADRLAAVLPLGPEENLVPVRTDYRMEGGQNLATREITNFVVANRIVFGRTIRGVPVVGGGSRVVLTFANDGALESFQYDWPRYETLSDLPLVDVKELLARVQRAIGSRTDVPVSTLEPRPQAAAPDYAVQLMKDTVLQKLECGYYDPGLTARDSSAPVQPGCTYLVIYQGGGGERAGASGAIPGAAQIEADRSWPEAAIFRGPGPDEKPIVPGPSRAQ